MINCILVFLMSVLPVIELKGAIPFGLSLGLPFWASYVIALIGSCLPSLFVVFSIERVLDWMTKSKVKFLRKSSKKLYKKIDKNRAKIDKYGYLGLFAFVAIPLPGTGVWTGSMIAGVLEMKPKKAILMIIFGNICAGLCMLALSDIFF